MLTTQEAKSPEFSRARLSNLVSSVMDEKIITLVVETVSRCNLQCNFCDAHSGRAPEFRDNAGIMSSKTWDNFYSSLQEYVRDKGPVHMLQFYGNGEPLLDPNLEDRLSSVKTNGLCSTTRVITNGTLLSSSRLTTLIEAGLDELHLSLDIMDKDVYKKVKKLDSCEKVVDNVSCAIDIIEATKTTQLFIKYFKGGKSHDYGVSEKDGEKVEEYFMESAKNSHYVHLKSQQLVDTGVGFLEGVDYFSKPCEIPFYLLYVKHTGDVSACCTDVFSALTVGSINDCSLIDILRGQALADIRLKHIQSQANKIPLCAGCGNRTAVDTSELNPDVKEQLINSIKSYH